MQKMSVWGIGPLFTVLSIGYSIIIFWITYSFYPLFRIGFIPYSILAIIGIALILFGFVFLISAVKAVTQAYNSNRLVTNGIFRCCRHPLYASWVVFIVPGIILISNSSLGLTIPVFMYFLLRILAKKEEQYLEEVFGDEYSEYKTRVPQIIPYGCLQKKWLFFKTERYSSR